MNEDADYEFVIVAEGWRYAIIEYEEGENPVCLEVGNLRLKPIMWSMMTYGDMSAVDGKTFRRILNVVEVGEIPPEIYDEVASALIRKRKRMDEKRRIF